MLKLLKNNMTKGLLCLGQIIVAILLLINPEGFTSGIVIAAGILMMLVGLLYGLKYVKLDPKQAAKEHLLVKGILFLIGGFFMVVRNDWLLELFPLLAVVYGAALLLTGVLRLQWAADLLRLKAPGYAVMGIGSLVTIILALIIMFHPVFIQAMLWTFAAISLMIGAVIDAANIVIDIRNKKEA